MHDAVHMFTIDVMFSKTHLDTSVVMVIWREEMGIKPARGRSTGSALTGLRTACLEGNH